MSQGLEANRSTHGYSRLSYLLASHLLVSSSGNKLITT